MKKVMATMLAAATAATMLSGCGSSNSGSTETKAAETTACLLYTSPSPRD